MRTESVFQRSWFSPSFHVFSIEPVHGTDEVTCGDQAVDERHVIPLDPNIPGRSNPKLEGSELLVGHRRVGVELEPEAKPFASPQCLM